MMGILIGAEVITVTRATAGSLVAGRLVPGATSTLSLMATVLPVSPKEMLVLDLGDQVKAVIDVYCETAIKTADEPGQTPADVITWQGSSWRVISAAHRDQLPGLDHYKATAARIEGT